MPSFVIGLSNFFGSEEFNRLPFITDPHELPFNLRQITNVLKSNKQVVKSAQM